MADPDPADIGLPPAAVTGPDVLATAGGPLEEDIEAVIDSLAKVFVKRPIVHAGLMAARAAVDFIAPTFRAALAAAGYKIVKI